MAGPIVVVGSMNLDLVAGAPHIPVPGETVLGHSFETFSGGKGGNQAVAAARLGAEVTMIGAVGEDAFGERLRGDLASAGVDVSSIESVEGPSGTALISRGNGGENSIIVVPGANAALTPAHVEKHLDRIAGAGMVLLQLEVPLETVECVARHAAESGAPVMLDPAPAQALPDALLRNLAWLTPNETEQAILLDGSDARVEDAAMLLLARGAKNVALKLGRNGVYIAGRGFQPQLVPGFAVDAVDTTAAGDVFNAAFAVALVEGQSAIDAARFASAAAAVSVTRRGSQASAPSRDEVMNLLESLAPVK